MGRDHFRWHGMIGYHASNLKREKKKHHSICSFGNLSSTTHPTTLPIYLKWKKGTGLTTVRDTDLQISFFLNLVLKIECLLPISSLQMQPSKINCFKKNNNNTGVSGESIRLHFISFTHEDIIHTWTQIAVGLNDLVHSKVNELDHSTSLRAF